MFLLMQESGMDRMMADASTNAPSNREAADDTVGKVGLEYDVEFDFESSSHTGWSEDWEDGMEEIGEHGAVVDTMILRAIADAQQTDDLVLQHEAFIWLSICCPDIADQLGLPLPLEQQDSGDLLAYPRRYNQY